MVEATSLPAAWQVRFQAGDNEGRADTVKDGTGGSAGLRPHELLEASLATCMTISARMALSDLGIADGEVRVRVHLERERSGTRFRYELILDPALEPHRPAVTESIERSPVRSTLSKQLTFEPVVPGSDHRSRTKSPDGWEEQIRTSPGAGSSTGSGA